MSERGPGLLGWLRWREADRLTHEGNLLHERGGYVDVENAADIWASAHDVRRGHGDEQEWLDNPTRAAILLLLDEVEVDALVTKQHAADMAEQLARALARWGLELAPIGEVER